MTLNQGVHYASEIREFSVYFAEFSEQRSVAYDNLLFRRGASFKIFSCLTLHLSPATRILNENPANYSNKERSLLQKGIRQSYVECSEVKESVTLSSSLP